MQIQIDGHTGIYIHVKAHKNNDIDTQTQIQAELYRKIYRENHIHLYRERIISVVRKKRDKEEYTSIYLNLPPSSFIKCT